MCLEEFCKWRQALASHTHPHARSRHAHAHRALCHALRRPPAQCRSPACRRCRYMSPPSTVARIKTCSDARLQHATGGARTRASPLVSSPRRPPSWWSTHGTFESVLNSLSRSSPWLLLAIPTCNSTCNSRNNQLPRRRANNPRLSANPGHSATCRPRLVTLLPYT